MWTITDVARLSGVTSRTLRHYDAVGLLRPAATGAGGRRRYGRAELARLQQIVVLRELGVDLATIGRLLEADGDDGARLALLRRHHERLVAERDRFDRLAATVAATIRSLEEGEDMAPTDMFDGFDNSQHEAEVRERWGDHAWESSNASWDRLGAEGRAAFAREQEAVGTGLAAALAEGLAPDAARTQALVARHYAQITAFWTPDAEAYAALGRMYVEDERFTATYDAISPGLAPYLRDAMAVYARENLA